MATPTHADHALIEVSPETYQRLRDPRWVLGMLLCVSGGIAVFIGYWGVSATLDPGKQLPYIISGGIGGVFLLGLGASLLFANDIAASRRDITDLRHLVEAISETLDEIRAAQDAEASDADASPNGVPRRNRPLDARK